MKILTRLLLTAVLAAALTTVLAANGLNLNGNGSKANAMGGAFVGLANDFSAAYWNPAGLAQMTGPSLSIYGSDILPFGTYALEAYGIDAKSTFKHYLIPGLGYFQPIGDRVVVGLYVYAPSGAGSTWDGEDLAILTGGTPYEWYSMLGLFTASPAISVKLSDKVMVGATVDISYGMLNMDQPFGLGQYSERLKGLAFGGTIGLLIKPVEQFSFGATYKLPFKAKLKGDVEIPNALLVGADDTVDTGTREATWPMWIAAGIAVKPFHGLTLTADVQYTNWKKMQTIPISFEDPTWDTFFGAGGPYDCVDELLWKNTTQLRFGAEYMVTKSFALRGGYYYDPSPGPLETQNILLPEFTYNWFTLGFGYQSEKFVIDASVEYGPGKGVTVPLAEGYAMPGDHCMKIVAPSLSFTYRF
jgi:long-chain fatty acid transport protein